MAETISVSLTGGYMWRANKSFGVLMEMIVNMTRFSWRSIEEGVTRKFRLDSSSRAEDGNPWSTKKKTEKEIEDDKFRERAKDIWNLRRGNKGLDMELLISSVLTHVDHPVDVLCNCFVYKGMPNKAAGGGEPDIVYRPQQSADFQIVCEVSACKKMTDSEYREQLDSALDHAGEKHDKAEVKVTYVLLVNLREASTDTKIHKVYHTFVKENEDTLRLWGPIRFVLMESVELSTLLKRLDFEDVLACRSDLLAGALDGIHDALWEKKDKVPTEEDWMADRMYSMIYEGSQMTGSLVPAPREVERGDE